MRDRQAANTSNCMNDNLSLRAISLYAMQLSLTILSWLDRLFSILTRRQNIESLSWPRPLRVSLRSFLRASF